MRRGHPAVTVQSARAVEIAAGVDVDAEIAALTGRIGRRKHGRRLRAGRSRSDLLRAGLLKAGLPKAGGIGVGTGSGRPYRRSATC